MSKDLKIDDLEAGKVSVSETTETAKTKKVKSAEELAELQATIEAGVAKMNEFGVSDNMAQVMRMAPMWADTEANAAVKQEVQDYFGGSDKLKDYVDGDFQEELKVIEGLQKVYSTLNNIKSFYARRATSTKSKVKFTPINIGGEIYQVNSEFFASLTGTSAEKREAVLAHADTKKTEAIETL